VALGLLVSLAWRPSSPFTPGSNPEASQAAAIIDRLEAEQRQLKSSLAQVRQGLDERQQSAAANTDRLQALQAELQRQRLLAGLVAVEGPGVVVTLDDSAVRVPPGADPNTYIIHEYDLRDIVNLLWMAGSEGIAINDERLVNNSSVYCVGSTVLVNNTRLSPPYAIRAIGDSRVQQDYMRNPSYLKGLKDKERLYGLRFGVKSAARVTLPAYGGGFLIRYGRAGE